MLEQVKLALCSNRSVSPKSNEIYGSPEKWFSNDHLLSHQLMSLSFDFFVNWSLTPPQINTDIWIKRTLPPEVSYDYLINNVRSIIQSDIAASDLMLIKSVIINLKLNVNYLIFNDSLQWSSSDSKVVLVKIVVLEDESLDFIPIEYSIAELQVIIKRFSGGPISVGKKGLTYGTSNLECFLSATQSLYPGDLDGLLFNDKHIPIAMFEYKKHNLLTAISNQKLENYYPHPDGRKYDRLAILQQYFKSLGFDIPLFCIYYPTNTSYQEGKLELIGGSYRNLHSIHGRTFLLPPSPDSSQYSLLLELINRAITSYMTIKEK